MLLIYDINELTFAITNQSGSGAAFLTDSSNLDDGRSGSGTMLRWTNGAQSTASFVEITATISSQLDAVARQGGIGLINVSAPLRDLTNLRCTLGGVEQRLVAGERFELNAWAVKRGTGNSLVIRLYNDNGAGSPLQPADEVGLGEILVGRIVRLCTLTSTPPSSELVDPTAFQRTSGNQVYALMRKGYRQLTNTLGAFTQAQAKGGAASDLPDGAVGTIDVQTLRGILSRSRKFAVCDTPGTGSSTQEIVYDPDYMQTNWMMAKMITPGQITCNLRPLFTWNPSFQEAM